MTFALPTTFRTTVVACGLGFALLLSSCAVPTSEGVQPLPTDGRQDLIEGTTSTSSTLPDLPDEDIRNVWLYFVGADQLERVIRPFPPDSNVDDVLDALVQGPLPGEVTELNPLTTRITEDLAPDADGGSDDTGTQTVVVRSEADLQTTIEQEVGNARLIVSQIVCTVINAIDRITGVRIVDETGESIEVVSVSGELINGPARASHFNDCRTGQDLLEEQIESEQNESEENESTTTTAS